MCQELQKQLSFLKVFQALCTACPTATPTQAARIPGPSQISLHPGWVAWLTWAPMPLLHPDVAVVLGHPGLRVQEWETHAALCTQAGVVTPAVFNGFLVELVPKPAGRQREGGQ